MEYSKWFEVVTHPISGKRTTLYADTELLLEGKIAAWRVECDDLSPAHPVMTGPVRRS